MRRRETSVWMIMWKLLADFKRIKKGEIDERAFYFSLSTKKSSVLCKL